MAPYTETGHLVELVDLFIRGMRGGGNHPTIKGPLKLATRRETCLHSLKYTGQPQSYRALKPIKGHPARRGII